jgi:RNA polymerase sigma-70 factor, ECF subfamily
MRVAGKDGSTEKPQDGDDAPPRATPTSTYRVQADFVQRTLRRFGVSAADLDDLCHEVFLVVHEQSEQLAAVDNVRYWLRAICWRVAAAYRRRAYRRLEVPAETPPETTDEGASTTLEELEALQEQTRLLESLDLLDDSQRDLIALHDLGDLPIVELARLAGCDRKTAHKRLMLAHRRLAILLRDGQPRRPPQSSALPRPTPPDLAPAEGWLSDRLQIVDLTRDVNIGTIGNVVLTTWPGPASVEAMKRLWSVISDLVETCGGQFLYFATVSAATRPPSLEARKLIIDLLQTFGPFCQAYGTALEGGMSWIVKPVMTGLAMLTRPKFPLRFLSGVPAASAWIAPRSRGPAGPLAPDLLAAAVTHLRHLES